MTSSTPHHETEPQPTRLDQLIDAIVDGSAAGSEWDEFRVLAGTSTEPWRRLAEEQRLVKTLESGFDAEVCGAFAVELPARQALAFDGPRRSSAPWQPALGWAAALLLGLAWAGSTLIPPTSGPTAAPASGSTGTLLAQYMAQPYVVGELPVQIRDVSQTESGEFVTYVRQIVERRPVSLYNLQLDENSNPVLRDSGGELAMLASRY